MKRFTIALVLISLVVAAVAVIGAKVTAQGLTILRATIHGYEEVPSVSTTAFGEFRAKINSDGTAVDYEMTFQGLQAPILFSHIHLSGRGTNGGVMAFLCGGGGKPACPQSGTVTGTIVAADIVGPASQGVAAGEFGEFLDALRSGFTYVNIHSTMWPGGELRGQISVDAVNRF